MAKKSKSVLKTARQAEKRRILNRHKKQKLKKMLKEIRNIKDKDAYSEALPKVQALIDKSAQKGIIHKNTAARLKSKLVKQINRIKIKE